MAVMSAFLPAYTEAQTITATTTSQGLNIGKGNKSLVITNLGSVSVYVSIGQDAAPTATAADFLVRAGDQVCLGKAQDADYVAVLAASTTAVVHIIQGEGLTL
jgi:hypothetical protein